MEGNKFTGKPHTDPTWYNFGAVVDNIASGYPDPISDNIYRNIFDTLTIAACSIGQNTGTIHYWFPAGLQISCNSFAGNATAISVLTDGITGTGAYFEGIGFQQAPGSLEAANTFTGSPNNILNNTINDINFYYRHLAAEWPAMATVSTHRIPRGHHRF